MHILHNTATCVLFAQVAVFQLPHFLRQLTIHIITCAKFAHTKKQYYFCVDYSRN